MDRGLQRQPPSRQRTPLQSLSLPSLNSAPCSTADAPTLNELHPTATAVPVRIETVHGVVTPNHGRQASIAGYVGDDDNDDVLASPTPSTNLCEDCCARPREYGLQGECSPRFCSVCAELHRHASRPVVVRMPPIPESGPWMQQPGPDSVDISKHACELRNKRRRREHLDAATKTAIGKASSLETIVAKRSNYDVFREQLFGGMDGNENPISRPCKPQSCTNCACLGLFDMQPEAAVQHLFTLRTSMVGSADRTKPRKKRRRRKHGQFYDTAVVSVRGHQAGRGKRLLQELQCCLFYDDRTREYNYQFSLPARTGQRLRVCGNFFRVVLGYDASNTQWRTALRKCRKQTLERSTRAELQDFACVAKLESNMLDKSLGRKGRITLQWLANHIFLYTVPLPMVQEIRFDFAGKKQLYEFLRTQFVVTMGYEEDFVDEHFFVGERRFLQMMQTPMRYTVIRDAVLSKLDDESVAGQTWKLTFRDPAKKRDFKLCTCCGANAELRSKAVHKRDKDLFRQALVYQDLHIRLVMARRHLFYKNQRLALLEPDVHLTIIVDAMAHHALDGPVLSRNIRWTKLTEKLVFMGVHLQGALSWGKARCCWCFFHDFLVQKGANNTAEVIVRILENLSQSNELPNNSSRRVLHLQCDNAGDNKNWTILVLCALLVHGGLFTSVELDFLHVGHTHECIDQVFAVIANWMRGTEDDISTLAKMMFHVEKLLNARLVEEMLGCRDFGAAFEPFLKGSMSGHSFPYSYRFVQSARSGEQTTVDMFYQTSEGLDGPWYPITDWLNEELLSGPPLRGPLQMTVETFRDYDATKMVKTSNRGKIVDLFAESLAKLHAQHVHGVRCLSDESKQFWLDRIEAAHCAERLQERMGQVRTVLDIEALSDDVVVGRTERQNLTHVLHRQEALRRGQLDGHFTADRMRTITVSHTMYTEGRIAKWNAADEVRNNIVRRLVLSQNRSLQEEFVPDIGELVVWAYASGREQAPETQPLFMGVVIQIVTRGGNKPNRRPEPAIDKTGAVPFALGIPDLDDDGTMTSACILVLTYCPHSHSATNYEDMERHSGSAFVDQRFTPIQYPSLHGNDDPRTRMERQWIYLEDIVACAAIVGTPIEVNGLNLKQHNEPFRHKANVSGEQFRFTSDDAPNRYTRTRVKTAIDHHRCGVATSTVHMCTHCQELYHVHTGTTL